MKKLFSKKAVLLFAGAMAVCAFAMPAMASASSWGALNSHHTLTSTNLGFLVDSAGSASMCTGASFTARVASAANLEITASTFVGCLLAVPGAGATCTMTSTGINLPWTATAVTTSNIQIHGVDINILMEGGACSNLAGQTLRITGTLSLGRWTGNGAGQHSVEVLGATGLVTHHNTLVPFNPPTLTGTIGDSTLTVTG